jgi:hypothetical protein
VRSQEQESRRRRLLEEGERRLDERDAYMARVAAAAPFRLAHDLREFVISYPPLAQRNAEAREVVQAMGLLGTPLPRAIRRAQATEAYRLLDAMRAELERRLAQELEEALERGTANRWPRADMLHISNMAKQASTMLYDDYNMRHDEIDEALGLWEKHMRLGAIALALSPLSMPAHLMEMGAGTYYISKAQRIRFRALAVLLELPQYLGSAYEAPAHDAPVDPYAYHIRAIVEHGIDGLNEALFERARQLEAEDREINRLEGLRIFGPGGVARPAPPAQPILLTTAPSETAAAPGLPSYDLYRDALGRRRFRHPADPTWRRSPAAAAEPEPEAEAESESDSDSEPEI